MPIHFLCLGLGGGCGGCCLAPVLPDQQTCPPQVQDCPVELTHKFLRPFMLCVCLNVLCAVQCFIMCVMLCLCVSVLCAVQCFILGVMLCACVCLCISMFVFDYEDYVL